MTSHTADRLESLRSRRADEDRIIIPTDLRGAPEVPAWRNPTVLLLAATIAGWTVAWSGYLTGALSGWVVVPLNAIATFLGFTVFHESVHRTAHRDRFVNDAMGWLPALMLTYVYPVFRACHLQHHAHTNDPELDPDHAVANQPAMLRLLWLVWTGINYRRLCHRHRWSSTAARTAQLAIDGAILLAVPVSIATGWFPTLWALYLGPLMLAGPFLFYTFDFLPHRPHESTERYHDTRIQPGRLRHAILLGQNYHLIHHLWVSIPWYRYRRVFVTVESELRAKGARID